MQLGDGESAISGGQKYRLAIARALYEKKIINFYEPTASLDTDSSKKLIEVLKN